jgi:transposase
MPNHQDQFVETQLFKCFKAGMNAVQTSKQLQLQFDQKVSQSFVKNMFKTFKKDPNRSMPSSSIGPLVDHQINDDSSSVKTLEETFPNSLGEFSLDSLHYRYEALYSPLNVPSVNQQNYDEYMECDSQSGTFCVTPLNPDDHVSDAAAAAAAASVDDKKLQIETQSDSKGCFSLAKQMFASFNLEQKRLLLLHCFLQGKSVEQTITILHQLYGEKSYSRRVVYQRFKRFKDSNFDLKNKRRKGRGKKVTDGQFFDFIQSHEDALSVDIADNFNVDVSTVYRRMKKLGFVLKKDQWVPYQISPDNKRKRLNICKSLIRINQSDPFLDCLITCDEKWLFHDN